jgi:glutamine synthetase
LSAVLPSTVDPYLVFAALIEGLVGTVAQRIPLAKQCQASAEIVRPLRDRLQELGATWTAAYVPLPQSCRGVFPGAGIRKRWSLAAVFGVGW